MEPVPRSPGGRTQHTTANAGRSPTVKEVAARAGVGVGTVSRVLNDHPAVTADTRARVRDAMIALDFRPNRAARALSRRRSGAIAVVVPFFTHPSSVERLRGVLSVIDETVAEVVLFSVDHAKPRRHLLEQVLGRDVADGLLIVSLRLLPAEAHRIELQVIPTVTIDAEIEHLPTVVVNDIEGGRLAARHLLELGHRHIAFIGDAVEPCFGSTSSARRLSGLTEELDAAGVGLDPGLVREGPHSADAARQLAAELLGRRARPTAVFAHSDTQALGVLEAARELRLRVPQDLSVMGFDDIESARHAGLTTVRQPLFESGRVGGTLLLDSLHHAAPPDPPRIELPLDVVVRRTTAPPRPRARRSRASTRTTAPSSGYSTPE
jgi:DNA-binding LacI/PurR family transcriptional regulator